ncbi:MAG: hypothetical protein WDW38_005788 [Sanguina aurantia]
MQSQVINDQESGSEEDLDLDDLLTLLTCSSEPAQPQVFWQASTPCPAPLLQYSGSGAPHSSSQDAPAAYTSPESHPASLSHHATSRDSGHPVPAPLQATQTLQNSQQQHWVSHSPTPSQGQSHSRIAISRSATPEPVGRTRSGIPTHADGGLEPESSPAETRGSDDSGEELYSQVLALLLNHTVLAGKVTGVLLDLGQSEVDRLLEDQEWMQSVAFKVLGGLAVQGGLLPEGIHDRSFDTTPEHELVGVLGDSIFYSVLPLVFLAVTPFRMEVVSKVTGILLDLDPAQLLSIARSPDTELPSTVTKVLEQLHTRADLHALGVTLLPPLPDPDPSGADSLDLGISSPHTTPSPAQLPHTPHSVVHAHTEPPALRAGSTAPTASLQQPPPPESESTASGVAPALGYSLSTILQRQRDLASRASSNASASGDASPGSYQPVRASQATAAQSMRVPGVYPGITGDDSMLVIPMQVPGGRLAEWSLQSFAVPLLSQSTGGFAQSSVLRHDQQSTVYAGQLPDGTAIAVQDAHGLARLPLSNVLRIAEQLLRLALFLGSCRYAHEPLMGLAGEIWARSDSLVFRRDLFPATPGATTSGRTTPPRVVFLFDLARLRGLLCCIMTHGSDPATSAAAAAASWGAHRTAGGGGGHSSLADLLPGTDGWPCVAAHQFLQLVLTELCPDASSSHAHAVSAPAGLTPRDAEGAHAAHLGTVLERLRGIRAAAAEAEGDPGGFLRLRRSPPPEALVRCSTDAPGAPSASAAASEAGVSHESGRDAAAAQHSCQAGTMAETSLEQQQQHQQRMHQIQQLRDMQRQQRQEQQQQQQGAPTSCESVSAGRPYSDAPSGSSPSSALTPLAQSSAGAPPPSQTAGHVSPASASLHATSRAGSSAAPAMTRSTAPRSGVAPEVDAQHQHQLQLQQLQQRQVELDLREQSLRQREEQLRKDLQLLLQQQQQQQQPVETSSSVSSEEHIPHHYLCPISECLMTDPVILSDGFTFERSYISKWLVRSNSSPCTMLPLKDKTLIPNRGLLHAIEAWQASQAVDTPR